MRCIGHTRAANVIKDRSSSSGIPETRRINHVSLSSPEEEAPVAAGEINLRAERSLDGLSLRTGRWNLKLELITGKILPTFPFSVLALESPTFTRLVGLVASDTLDTPIEKLYLYATDLLIVRTA